VVQTQSVTKASEALNLSQPAVSIQLKNFQDQFGVPLIEVIGRKLYITDFGKEIAEAAENIINQVYAINYKSLAYKNQLTGRLKIASVSTGKYVMPFFLSGFMRQHAGIELLMDVTNKDKVFESLKNNEIDFGLVSFLPSNLEVENLDLLQDKLYLVGKRETNTGENITAKKMFENLPIIFREPGSGTRQLMEKFLQSNNITVLRKMELTSNEAVKQSLLAGIGYSIMPFIGIRKEIESKDLQIIPVKGLPLKITWNLIWLKGKKLSPTAASFLEYLQLNKQQIVDDTFSWPEL
jgi:DNA-binding transcriptional LysR family regulator